eukprot:5971544-Pyramimonas_sp.AAC.1
MSDLFGKAYGKWANAAERALATATQNPMKATARRGQPIRYREVPFPQHVASKQFEDTAAGCTRSIARSTWTRSAVQSGPMSTSWAPSTQQKGAKQHALTDKRDA